MKDLFKFIVYTGLFTVPFLALYVENSLFFPYITGKNFAFRIIVEVVFASWIILCLYDAEYRPRFSWVSVSFASLIVVMFIADFFGRHPQDSFWSNFERMDGFVTLVHVFLYAIIMGSVMRTVKVWNRFFNTTLLAAVLLSMHAFGQIAGVIEHRYGGFRVDATLGNATYMAVYMLFHSFIAVFMASRASSVVWRNAYLVLSIIFAYMLIQTATRGTTLALVIGVIFTTIYIALSSERSSTIRKTTVGVLLAIVCVIGLFISVRHTEFVQNSQTLTRIANISLSEGANRFNIWKMAFQGVKERPLLGWGQSNYNYVFNKYYKPELHGQEAWFDRVHNIVMDWLIAGGVIGTIAYFSILLSAVYYLFYRPLRGEGDNTFSVVERGILLGLLVGYTAHNMFVFDNIVSYIFYGTILGYIYSRVGVSVPQIEKWKVSTRVIEQVAMPVVGVVLVATLYFVNVPGIQAAGDIIKAFRTTDPEEMLKWFETALARDSFGNQEIREQMTQKVQGLLQAQGVPEELKQRAFKRVEEELLKQAVEKPGDARVHVFISSFYRMTNNMEPAIAQLAIARSLSPNKQLIIYEQGLAQLQKQEYAKATEFFKQAYDLGPQFDESRIYYAMSAVYSGQLGLVDELITTPEQKKAFALNDLAVQAVYKAKMYTRLIEMFYLQIAQNPEDPQVRTNLAYVLNETGDTEGAIATLNKAGEDIPSFKEQANAFIASILNEKNKPPVTTTPAPVGVTRP